MRPYIYFLLICQSILIIKVNAQELLVTIDQGIVRGHKHASRDVYEFYGIPYARVPTGREKFKAPLPAERWNGILDAVDNTIVCPQNIPIFPFTEDCLIVNVFVPEISNILKSVIVYIHGGGFVVGFGNMVTSHNLVERDIVVVTFNYRLGSHGFLCMNTENIPGNAGLKDQLAALRWVQNNIQEFGGNPNDVTLGGGSAGSASTELLMLSAAANNLFNKVILESASGTATWAVNPNGLELAQYIASQNGVTDVENLDELEDFYFNLSHRELIALSSNNVLGLDFSPCIDQNSTHEEVVIAELPIKILESGNYSKIPLLTGFTDAEGLFMWDRRQAIMAAMNEDSRAVLPSHFDSYARVNETEAIDLIREFYFNEEVVNEDSVKNYTDYLTDILVSYSIVESAKLHATNSSVPVYLYEFSYVTSFLQTVEPSFGATHGAQSAIIYDGTNENMSENDLLVQARTVDMWANFIKFGEPVSIISPDYWEPLDPEEMNYLAINLNMQNRTFPMPERLRFWDQIWKGPNSACHINTNILMLLLSILLLINNIVC